MGPIPRGARLPLGAFPLAFQPHFAPARVFPTIGKTGIAQGFAGDGGGPNGKGGGMTMRTLKSRFGIKSVDGLGVLWLLRFVSLAGRVAGLADFWME